jgi:hypothetical protein
MHLSVCFIASVLIPHFNPKRLLSVSKAFKTILDIFFLASNLEHRTYYFWINITGSNESISILREWESVLLEINNSLKSPACTVPTLSFLLRDFERPCSILNP